MNCQVVIAPCSSSWVSASTGNRFRPGWHRMPAWNPESPFIALLCMRGKFRVTDPPKVRGLKLSMSYQGGVVA